MDENSPLGQLISAYLNEDLFDFYGSVMGAVDAFVADDPDLARQLPAQVDDLIDETDLDDIVLRHGVGFVAGDRSYRDWLIQIADRVRVTTT